MGRVEQIEGKENANQNGWFRLSIFRQSNQKQVGLVNGLSPFFICIQREEICRWLLPETLPKTMSFCYAVVHFSSRAFDVDYSAFHCIAMGS